MDGLGKLLKSKVILRVKQAKKFNEIQEFAKEMTKGWNKETLMIMRTIKRIGMHWARVNWNESKNKKEPIRYFMACSRNKKD